jgi:uncharacterized NAD-dependent epimerase/dehydratase family protein
VGAAHRNETKRNETKRNETKRNETKRKLTSLFHYVIKSKIMLKDKALLLTSGLLDSPNGKTAHGLIRSSERFEIVGVIDPPNAGKDAGEILDGKHRNIPIFATLDEALKSTTPQYLIIGVAVAGGKIPTEMLAILKDAITYKLHIINGLHEFLNDKPEFIALAQTHGVTITDVRRAKKATDMQYWSGRIGTVTTPRVAVLGMDCAVGKRTTCRFLVETCRKEGIKAEIISTGQTGWMQDGRYGFILDSTLNDFVTGELETQIVNCHEEAKPDIIFLNGQSALRNPMGPCGAELLLSGQAKYVVLQAIPGRKHYEGTEDVFLMEIPSVASEIELIKMYGSEVIAVTLNTTDLTPEEAREHQRILREQLGIPVVLPLEDGVGEIVAVLRKRVLM